MGEQSFFKQAVTELSSNKRLGLMMLAIDILFLLAMAGIVQLNILAFNMGISAASSIWLKIPYLIAYLFVTYVLVVLVKCVHLAVARKMLLPGMKTPINQNKLMGFSLVFFIMTIIAYSLFGWGITFVTGTAQIILIIAFMLAVSFGILWMYPAQWFLVQGEGVWKSISRGLATFKSPTKPLQLFLFAVLIEVVLFLLYIVNIMLAKNPSLDPAILAARYDSIINVWLVIFKVATYIILFGARLILYVQNTPTNASAASSPITSASIKAKPSRKPKAKPKRKK